MSEDADASAGETKDVLLAIAGSDEAFARLTRTHQAWLQRLLRRVCGDATLADDLTQVALVKAWRRIGDLRDASLFAAWLRRIALNAAIDAVRANKIQTTPLHATLGTTGSDEESDRRLDLEAAMRRLSFAQRACIQLAFGGGMSHAEIGAALRMPVGTVKSHIARALPLLRAWLKEWSVDHG